MEQITPTLCNWASILDQATRTQAIKTASMEFIYPHLALMPDAHLGKGATVGSVIPTLGFIMPAAVGVDIGCGMIAVRTQWTRQDFINQASTNLAPLREAIERAIPLSPGNYNNGLKRKSARERIAYLEDLEGIDSAKRLSRNPWEQQLGSLGGGNHFIEISLDEDDRVWAFLHSGSRGVGNNIATHHIAVAQERCRGVRLPDRDLAYLDEADPEFWDYITDLRWAQEFALLNREEMMDRVLECLQAFMGEQVRPFAHVNCHHNYTEREVHFGKEVWLSRKGAIDAHKGVWGLIPGSMGDRSYVVKGKGNEMALSSSPHGAGRVHSRASAKREFTLQDLEERMAGIEWRHDAAFIDEHPAAYKPIDTVMADSADLVEVVHEFRQILNVKGE